MFKVDKGTKSANVQRTVRFTEELFDRLSAEANANDISFNNLVLQCCKYALDNMEKDD